MIAPSRERRPTFDFSDKWSSPKYDFLGEFYSSHVNPVFWRLHGWVDDRIEDWFRAQESARPGTIRRRQLHGVTWFEPNPQFVMVNEPFVGVSLEAHGGGHGGHDHAGHDQQAAEVATMLQVMSLIQNDGNRPAPAVAGAAPAAPRPKPRISMRFEMPGD